MVRVVDAILAVQNNIGYRPCILDAIEKFAERLAGHDLGKSRSRGPFRVEV